MRGGGAAPNDWATAWLALANRIAGWRQAREPENQQTLTFDNYDQARLA